MLVASTFLQKFIFAIKKRLNQQKLILLSLDMLHIQPGETKKNRIKNSVLVILYVHTCTPEDQTEINWDMLCLLLQKRTQFIYIVCVLG